MPIFEKYFDRPQRKYYCMYDKKGKCRKTNPDDPQINQSNIKQQ